jgi:beta-lactamase superfamily II metal-dependent hydrolase
VLNQLVLAVALLVTQYAGNLPFAFVDTSRFFPIYTLPFYIAIVMLFSLHNRVLTKHLLISFLAALNLAVFVAPPELGSAGKLRVGFLDVGQGDAAVIRFPDGRHVVIDAGPRAGGYDSGQARSLLSLALPVCMSLLRRMSLSILTQATGIPTSTIRRLW